MNFISTQCNKKLRNKELHDAAQPLLEFLYKYGCPHDVIVVDQTHVEMFSGECSIPFALRD